MNPVIRRAQSEDGPALLRLIDALADYENLTPPDRDAKARLVRDTFGEHPRVEAYLAELDGVTCGYALVFETYSSFLALPTLFLEDLFVLPEYRSRKVGSALFRFVAAEGHRRGCGRVEWAVLDWNQLAIDFYDRHGAQRLKEWLCYRMTRTEMARLLCLLLALFVPAFAAPDFASKSPDFFESKVRPVLAKNCFACHTNSALGGLRLDSRESVLRGGKSGPAIKPGDAEASLLMQAVTRTHERLKMPPSGKLADEDIATLALWIKDGAVWPEAPTPGAIQKTQFWAFQPLRSIAAGASIDGFVDAELERNGLKPVKPAARRVLLRRVTFDLTGLPPAPEEIDAFEADSSPGAFGKVVDRLLASPRYGERWGRFWLDLARYADGNLGASKDTPYANAFRYRDWVIAAFNSDMPYDRFLKAQIAADLIPESERAALLPALGFQALGHDNNDRVDVTTRTFLGFTVGCAQCHDHKYDPIPTKDYYSLLGVFKSSPNNEVPLAPADVVEAYKKQKKAIDNLQETIDDFIKKHSNELSELLTAKTARYLVAAWKVRNGAAAPATASNDALDEEILTRWVRYLKEPNQEHPYLKPWYAVATKPGAAVEEVRKVSAEFQQFVISVFAERVVLEDRNYVKLGGAKGVKDEATRQYTNLESLPIEKYYLWRDLASDPFQRNGAFFPGGVYYFGKPSSVNRDFDTRGAERPVVQDIDRFLSGEWKEHLNQMRAELGVLKKALGPQYPFLHAIKDSDKPANAKVAIRGDAQNLGEEAPRHFLSALCDGEPKPFTHGSGRLELAEAIAAHPLTARVIVNRVWQHHFGQGIVRSASNFGQLGDRPTHPELLDYLAARLIADGWSLKKLHREILLSAAYARSSEHDEANFNKDPDNRLLWRANLRPRMEVEVVRDSLLAVAGNLDLTIGGEPRPLPESRRRTVYTYIGRTKLDDMLSLFDFPNPNNTSEQRTITAGPMQRLFFLNNPFVADQAKALATRLQGRDDAEKIAHAYRLLFGRAPKPAETQTGLDYLRGAEGAWPRYAQILLSSSEFSSLN